MTKHRYTLEEIKARRNALAAELKVRERRIVRQWDDLVAPPEFEDQFHLWANRAEAAFSLYDGFMTGFKLLRTFGGLFRRKKSADKVGGSSRRAGDR